MAKPERTLQASRMEVGRTVMVVDDDHDVRASCADVLRSAGYLVVEAEDGVTALRYLRSGNIGAVLLDVYMPGMDGLSLLDEVDSFPPVVLLTAREYDNEIITRRAKVAMYVQKPVAPPDLLEVVSRLVGVA
jgi:two-component system chemotaxis response regulator CheY